jgi:tetratricopeptide (TPR) repeat protein
MKKLLMSAAALLLAVTYCWSQIPMTTAPSGGNKKASVSERIGLTDVSIHYDRPGVKGRQGKIWGQLVPVGFTDQGFGSSKAAPWRAGANENTTIEFSNAVKIEGQSLPAGKYGVFLAYDPNESTLIFSKNSTSWGSFFYDEKEDALRVKIKPQTSSQLIEWLKYEFNNQSESGATVSMQWEYLSFPFKIETDYVNDQIALFRRELRTERGFLWEGWNQAAQWCLQRNVNLPEALLWSDSATGQNFGGDKAFPAWSTKAQILEKLGRSDEAAAIMKKSMAFATVNEIHGYARSLVAQKKPKEAMEVFKENYAKNPTNFTTMVGMVRGYSANGDYKNALKLAQQALPLADALNKPNVQTMIDKLKEGKDVN